MATLSIKKMPEALHKRLKKEASAEGRSLNAELIYLLKQALASQQRMREWQSRRQRLEKLVAEQPYTANLSVEMLREDRERGRR
jgi:plasmid stability protein